jgi:hypothetical protein
MCEDHRCRLYRQTAGRERLHRKIAQRLAEHAVSAIASRLTEPRRVQAEHNRAQPLYGNAKGDLPRRLATLAICPVGRSPLP